MHVSSLLCVVAVCPYLLCIILGKKLPHPQNMECLQQGRYYQRQQSRSFCRIWMSDYSEVVLNITKLKINPGLIRNEMGRFDHKSTFRHRLFLGRDITAPCYHTSVVPTILASSAIAMREICQVFREIESIFGLSTWHVLTLTLPCKCIVHH
jgi:hypothetical protein